MRSEIANRPSRAALWSRSAAMTLLLAGATACQIPTDVLHLPRYIYDSLTNPNFVVNAPVVHDLLGVSRGLAPEATQRERFRLPPGFVMNVYADDVTLARFMRVTPAGDLIVTQPRKRRVLLLTRDADGDGRADEQRVLLDDLHLPHGVELVGDQLYVVGPEYILRAKFDVATGRVIGEPETFATLPEILGHSSRPLRLGPDGWLYTAIGSDCNACEPTHELEQTILRFDLESGRHEIVATGFRNVGHFDWHPETTAMFATEVGADYQGDDFPLEELNEIVAGRFYGFPYLHGPDFEDPELGPDNAARISQATPAAHTFTAHSTPLGMIFLRNEELPDDLRGSALVVLKGSWNRTRKSGYKVVSLRWIVDPVGGRPRIRESEFLSGFERDEDVIGRPVDIVEAPDGTLYLSDDTAGAIYRIRYAPSEAHEFAPVTPPVARAPIAATEVAATETSTGATVAMREGGAALFERHSCGRCHRPSNSQATAAVPLAGLALRRTLEETIEALATPPASMPRFLLTPEERRALAIYLLATE